MRGPRERVARFFSKIVGDYWQCRCAYCPALIFVSIYADPHEKAMLLAEHGAEHTR